MFGQMWVPFILLGCGPKEEEVSTTNDLPTKTEPEAGQTQPTNSQSSQTVRRQFSTERYSLSNIDTLNLDLPSRTVKVSDPLVLSDAQKATLSFLQQHLISHASHIDNPWALFHSLLAFGKEHKTNEGKPAVNEILNTYAQVENSSDTTILSLPASVESADKHIIIEPHEDLGLKVLTEIGVLPDHPVLVNDHQHEFKDLYLGSMLSSYLLPQQNLSSYHSTNDMPWSIQALSAYAPRGLKWISPERSVPMSMDDLTLFGVAVLAAETQFMKESMASGAAFERKGQGIFQYTCGGAHLLQGVSYAVARGFGGSKARQEIQSQVDLLFYRFPIELQIYDATLRAAPQYKHKLLVQRLKFVGHFIETVAKLNALGFYEPNTHQKAMIQGAADQLVLVTEALRQEGVFDDLASIQKEDPQMFLDLLGDSGHAVYGLELISGNRSISY